MKKIKITAYAIMGLLILLVAGGISIDYYIKSSHAMNKDQIQKSAQFNGKIFVNATPAAPEGIGLLPKIIKQMMFDKQQPTIPQSPVPVVEITRAQLDNLPKDETVFFKLGHSTLLLWLENEFWLIDPMFSDRASPFGFIGPKRFHPTPINVNALPAIKGVILSHNHYDHLDEASIKKLHKITEAFYMPLGIGADLIKWGVPSAKVREYDWHEGVTIGDISLTATPAQHFSGRGLSDRNQSLWASWVIKTSKSTLFYSGDSGYFDGFKTIGKTYGPFDLAFMEAGAYNTLWPDVHMTPEQTVQAYLDLNAKLLVPIHNSTFDLSVHTWFDPLEQVTKISANKGVNLLVPKMGDAVRLNNLPTLEYWWRDIM